MRISEDIIKDMKDKAIDSNDEKIFKKKLEVVLNIQYVLTHIDCHSSYYLKRIDNLETKSRLLRKKYYFLKKYFRNFCIVCFVIFGLGSYDIFLNKPY